MENFREPLTYESAGVDIDRADELISRIKRLASRTRTPAVLAGVGGFGALFELPRDRYRQPVLVSGTDGVGTKLKLAIELGRHSTIGIDLVAMCVNDIATLGAEPLFFLDYYATGKLDVDVAESVIEGIVRGCEQCGAALVGGETAELPGLYAGDDYDLAGFCVGVVERDQIIDGRAVRPGDALIGLASSGPHSNGYSLIRRVLERSGVGLDTRHGNRTLGEALLEPTRIYSRSLSALSRKLPVHAMAHITGGGLLENVPRVLPPNTVAHIDAGAWPRPPIFEWLKTAGNIASSELHRTFNCGIGMVICVPPDALGSAIDCLRADGEEGYPIGVVEAADGPPRVILDGADRDY